MLLIAQALWFFLPAFVANQCPGFAKKLNLPGSTPINEKLFGANKTWAAYYAGIFGSLVTVYLQRQCLEINASLALFDYHRSDVWLIGILFGCGAVVGDHLKSFFKRRRGIAPGDPWWPFDQLDFVVGSLFLTLPFVGWIGWTRITVIVITVLVLHPCINQLGFFMGIRKVPW